MTLAILVLILMSFSAWEVESQSISPTYIGSGLTPNTISLENGDFLVSWQDNANKNIVLYNRNGSLQKQIDYPRDLSAGSLALLADGSFVTLLLGLSNNTFQSFAQRYNADGTPHGNLIPLDCCNLTDLSQYLSSVAGLDDGGFVVTWIAQKADQTDQNYCQIFNSDDTPRGKPFAIFEGKPTSQRYSPVVTSLSSGGFWIFWTEVTVTYASNIYGQVFLPNGIRVGDPVIIDNTTIYQRNPATVTLKSGETIIIWQGKNSSSTSFFQTLAQIFGKNRTPKKSTFLIPTMGNSVKQVDSPVIAELNTGRFVIAWNTGKDDDFLQIYFQIYLAKGSPYSEPVLVTPTTWNQNDNRYPSITGMEDGGFIVTWSYCSLGPNICLSQPDNYGIFAQRYDKNGQLVSFLQDEINYLENFEDEHF